MIELLNYLNELDKSAIMREAHAANPQAALAQFGLTYEAQTLFLSGDNMKMVQSLGICIDNENWTQVNVSTY